MDKIIEKGLNNLKGLMKSEIENLKKNNEKQTNFIDSKRNEIIKAENTKRNNFEKIELYENNILGINKLLGITEKDG